MKTLSKFRAKSISGPGDIDRRYKPPPPPPNLQGSKKPRLNRVKMRHPEFYKKTKQKKQNSSQLIKPKTDCYFGNKKPF